MHHIESPAAGEREEANRIAVSALNGLPLRFTAAGHIAAVKEGYGTMLRTCHLKRVPFYMDTLKTGRVSGIIPLFKSLFKIALYVLSFTAPGRISREGVACPYL
jgi:hypothetical protein